MPRIPATGVILGLESSCDETALALFDPDNGLAGEWIHSQIALHETYGGVVPDLASREHLQHFAPLLRLALAETGVSRADTVAVTRGPGLAGCLAMGLSAAGALSVAWRAPLCGINHLRAHAFSPFLPLHRKGPADFAEAWQDLLPHLGLLVSGGNTLLFAIDAERKISEVASTRDDAAGEALDKGAKLLGLGYPGGPLIERRARDGNPAAFAFPTGMSRRDSLEFSFSGLKTSLRYRVEKMDDHQLEDSLNDLCASYQAAVIEALSRKTLRALEPGAFASLGLSGGVANNEVLRERMASLARQAGIPFFAAERQHTGDNAAMVAFAAWVDPLAKSAPEITLAPSLGIGE